MVATPAVEVLVSSGTAHRLHEYTHDPAASYGRETAEAIGTEPDRVFKTLVTADGASPMDVLVQDDKVAALASSLVREPSRPDPTLTS